MENPHAPDNDDAMTVTKYDRTEEQTRALGFNASDHGSISDIAKKYYSFYKISDFDNLLE